jgi:hypothetical protein
MKMSDIFEQEAPRGAAFISGRAAKKKAAGQLQMPSGGDEELARIIASFIPGISSIADTYDAIQAAKSGQYGDAALSSVLALLGLVPFAGVTKSAVSNFLKTNPKLAQQITGKAAQVDDLAAAKPATARAPDVPPAATRAPEVPPAATRAPEVPPAATRAPEVPPATARAPEVPPAATRASEVPPAATRAPDEISPSQAVRDFQKVQAAPTEIERLKTLAGIKSADAAADVASKASKADDVKPVAPVAQAASKADDVKPVAPVAQAASKADDVKPVAPAAQAASKVDDVAKQAGKVDDAPKLSTAQKVAAGGAAAAAVGGTAMLARTASPGAVSTTQAANTVPNAAMTQATSAGLSTNAQSDKNEPSTTTQSDKPGSAQAASTGQSAATSQPAAQTAPNLDSMSFNQAFAAARKAATAAGHPSTGQFTWKGKKYQTNVQGEPYVSMSKQTPVNIAEQQNDLYRILMISNYKR